MEQQVAQLAAWLSASKSACAFTGAGISTESGIPDFRSPGGVWSKNRTVYFDEFCQKSEERYEYWRQKAIAHQDFVAASPNETHIQLTNLENAKLLQGVVTQNIDGLHHQSGSTNVLELHGSARRVACLNCDWNEPADDWVALFLAEDRVPDCPQCGGLIKHATISFGQSLCQATLDAAVKLASESDLFLALGSSLVVEPAASLPRLAKQNQARLVIINRDPTPLDHIAELVINESLGQVFELLGTHFPLPSGGSNTE